MKQLANILDRGFLLLRNTLLLHSLLFDGKANLVRFTLFYSTLLALTHRRTDRRTDRETNTLALHGLEEPAHASRGLEEIQKSLSLSD